MDLSEKGKGSKDEAMLNCWWDLTLMTRILKRHSETEETMQRWRGVRTTQARSKEFLGHLQLKQTRKPLPWSHQSAQGPAHTQISALSLPDCENVNICPSELSSGCSFVIGAKEIPQAESKENGGNGLGHDKEVAEKNQHH